MRSRLLAHLPWVLIGAVVVLHLDRIRMADPDLFVTLYAGEEIVSRGEVPRVDSATFSVAGGPWNDYEWGARAIFYSLYARFGAAGLVALRALLATALVSILYAHAWSRGRSFPVFAVGSVAFAILMGDFFFFRPRLFTFVGMAGLLALLLRSRVQGRPRLLWLVPPLVVVWTNLHAGAALGVVVVGLLAGESLFVKSYATLRERGAPLLPFDTDVLPPGPVLACFLASFALSGLNPFGYDNWLAIFRTLGLETQIHYTEWRPLGLYPIAAAGPIYLAIAGVLGMLLLAHRRATLFEVALGGGRPAPPPRRVRFIPHFVIASTLTLLRLAPGFLEPGTRLGGWLSRVSRRKARWLATAASASALALVWKVECPGDLAIRKVESITPVTGVEFLRENGIGGRILNEYDWGGYIHFELPDARIFVDGRSDTVYPDAVLQDWIHFVSATEDWYAVPERYGAEVVFLRRGYPVVGLLERDPRWVEVHRDPVSAVFLRRVPGNATHLERYRAGLLREPDVREEDYWLR